MTTTRSPIDCRLGAVLMEASRMLSADIDLYLQKQGNPLEGDPVETYWDDEVHSLFRSLAARGPTVLAAVTSQAVTAMKGFGAGLRRKPETPLAERVHNIGLQSINLIFRRTSLLAIEIATTWPSGWERVGEEFVPTLRDTTSDVRVLAAALCGMADVPAHLVVEPLQAQFQERGDDILRLVAALSLLHKSGVSEDVHRNALQLTIRAMEKEHPRALARINARLSGDAAITEFRGVLLPWQLIAMAMREQPPLNSGTCQECGSQLPNDAAFCPRCGASLGSASRPSAEGLARGSEICHIALVDGGNYIEAIASGPAGLFRVDRQRINFGFGSWVRSDTGEKQQQAINAMAERLIEAGWQPMDWTHGAGGLVFPKFWR